MEREAKWALTVSAGLGDVLIPPFVNSRESDMSPLEPLAETTTDHTGQSSKETTPNNPLSADILYAYIGLVWLVLQEQETSLEATFYNWEQPPRASQRPLSKSKSSSSSRAAPTAASFWYDPLGLKAIINQEESKRHPALRSYVSWKTRLMDGLLAFNRLSPQERAAIAELSEYGVSVDALANSLHSTITSAETQQPHPSLTEPVSIPATHDLSYMILYNLIFTALKNVIAKTKELRYDARLRVLLRRISYIIFDATMGDGYHDERERLKIKCFVQQEIEHGAALQIWKEISEASTTANLDKNGQVESRHSLMSWQSKWLALGVATVGGGLFIGLTGGMAAPFLSAGLGSLFSYAGMTGMIATGIVEGLGTASGAMAMATLFGITGGSTTAYSFRRRLKDIEDFDLRVVFDNHPSLSIAICISGFLLSPSDVEEPWLSLPSKVPFTHIEALQFELNCLLEVGNSLYRFWNMYNTVEKLGTGLPTVYSKNASRSQTEPSSDVSLLDDTAEKTMDRNLSHNQEEGQQEPLLSPKKHIASPTLLTPVPSHIEIMSRPSTASIPQPSIMTSIVSAIAWPVSLLQNGYLVDSPWSLGLARAESAGHVLAKEVLLARLRGHRPVTLVGFSLGAVSIVHALIDLAKAGEAGNADAYAMIDSVYLFGVPMSGNPALWLQMSSVINGRWVNGYAPNDWMLQFLCRGACHESGGLSIFGLTPMPGIQQMHTALAEWDKEMSTRDPYSSTHLHATAAASPVATLAHVMSADVNLDVDQATRNKQILRKAKWVENCDVSAVVRHHLDYLEHMQQILDLVGFEGPSVVAGISPQENGLDNVFSTGSDPSKSSSSVPLTETSPTADADSPHMHAELAARDVGGGAGVDVGNSKNPSEVLFENPYAEEDIMVRGIHASNLLAVDIDGDNELDDSLNRAKSWTKQGVTFGRTFISDSQNESTSASHTDASITHTASNSTTEKDMDNREHLTKDSENIDTVASLLKNGVSFS
ncbi:hypothetical protein BASA81_014886 [Batrachochytrium salamandrivorans]|nr:hypothetical protein BASA81_014886 [Batrachochytrium salamandrivorans]